MRLLLAALCVASFLAAGCGANTAVVTRPGRAPYNVTMMRQDGYRLADLKTCLEPVPLGASSRDEAQLYCMSWMREIFRDVVLSAPDCDIAVKCTYEPYAQDLEITELTGGKPLMGVKVKYGGGSRARVVEELTKLFSTDADLKRVARRAGTMAASAAPATGMSREELGRMVAEAVKGAQTTPAARDSSAEPRYKSAERVNDVAIVVGIESYSDIATKAPYAERDADSMKSHLLALGVPERNIVLLKGPKAVKSSIDKYVGTWLPQMAKADSRVYFYFSGHGAPDVKSGKAFLVPWDGDPNFLEDTAVPLERLYAKLGALPSKRVLVAMDSCFSGAGGRSVLASGARPLVGKIDAGAATGKLTVLSAAGGSEISGSLDDKGHGAFTYFLLSGLNAGKTTPKALVEYLTPQVQDEARRLNRAQTPQLQGDGDWTLR